MRETHFGFAPQYTPLNHGSYGTLPEGRRILPSCSHLTRALFFVRLRLFSRPSLLAESRSLTADVLNCAASDLVFVPNATRGVDTVLKNVRWRSGDVNPGLRDRVRGREARGSTGSPIMTRPPTERMVTRSRRSGWKSCPIAFPETDDRIVWRRWSGRRGGLNNTSDSEGGDGGRRDERVRLAIVDTIVSMAGLRVPFERLVPALQAEGAMVLFDAAHGIGQIPIDIATLPDFLVTNLHKWFFVPRGCAALYVAKRIQALIRASLPTSARYRGSSAVKKDEKENAFVDLFDFVATSDTTNWLTAEIHFRNEICCGEEAIREYIKAVTLQGAEAAAEILGTEVMRKEGSWMLDCAARKRPETNDEGIGADNGKIDKERGRVDPSHAAKIVLWIKETGIRENGNYFQTCLYRGKFWWRLSGMIYVHVGDFRRGAEVLKRLCERDQKGEYLGG
ncbi:putative aminotransferase family protein [Xylariaceae sp. FL0594]|nr:putative aminotransferase family protein [Xylariaceae sp. FL0594]